MNGRTYTHGAPARPALRYHGGKWRLAPWILTHLPRHTCYVEPYGGAAAVLLCKPRAPLEVYNDRSRRVVNFFRVLREQPADLIRAIELTPYSRAEFEDARGAVGAEPLEAARQFYILSWQGRGGPTARWNSGWSFQRTDARGSSRADDWNRVDHLWDVAARLQGVQLECDNAPAVIARYDTPDTVFYCDPPYVTSVRSQWGSHNGHAYDYELTDDDHRQLAHHVHAVQGMVLLSGHPSPLYDALYADWHRVTCTARVDNGAARTECLWVSPHALARANQLRLPFMEHKDGVLIHDEV